MKKIVAVSLIFSLIISLAAPTGAVFATEGEVLPEEAVVLGEDVGEAPLGDSEIADKEAVGSTKVVDEPSETKELSSEPIVTQNDSSENAEVTNTTNVQASPAVLTDKSLAIAYVQASGTFGKYIEIRNVSSVDYHTKNLTLSYFRSNATSDNSSDTLATFYGTIKAGTSVTIGNNAISESEDQNADIYYSSTANAVMNADGGWLRLVENNTIELDSFCWSSAVNPPCGDDRYVPKVNLSGRSIEYTAYERCFNDNGSVVVCSQNGDGTRTVFKAAERRVAESRGGYVPFYNSCSGLEVSEAAPKLIDQFIEIYNSSDKEVSPERCILQINNSVYQFSWRDDPIGSKEYRIISPAAIKTTLARTTAGEIRILSSSSEVVSSLKYSAPKDDRSVVRDNNGDSVWTLKPTPGAVNEYIQYPPCEDGYWRNEDTGRCNKIVEVTTLTDCGEGRERNPATGRCRNTPTAKEYAPCKEGQYRSEETNRCRNIALAGGTLKPCKEGQYRSEETNRCRSIASAAKTLKPCADDQFRNPETNRCKKIASTDELADCGEGRERNPATNRCRNILASTVPTAGFSPEKVQQVAGATWGWWVFGGASALALGYAGWQWRWELKQLAIRSRSIFTRSGK